jgi:single-strand DNA-binding protein
MDYYSLNRVILIGYVGKDPEVRISKPNAAAKSPRKMAKFQLATKMIFAKGDKPRTTWHNCYAWGVRADFVEKYVKSGSLLMIEGRLDTYTISDEHGVHRKHIFVNIETVGFMPENRRPVPTAEPAGGEDSSLPEGAQDPIEKGNPFL